MKKNYKWYCSLIIAIPVAIFVLAVLYRYCIYDQQGVVSVYAADYEAHIKVADFFRQGDLSPVGKRFPHIFSYPLFHIATALLSFVTGSLNWACFINMVLSIGITVFGVRKLALRQLEMPTDKQRYLIDFFAITSVTMGSISGYVTAGAYYLPYGTFDTWHNPTIIFMRPFAIFATYYFLELFGQLKWSKDSVESSNGKLGRNGILFSVLLALSVLAKPNFALFFLVAAGLLTAVRTLKNIRCSPRQALSSAFTMLICVLPGIAIMLWQKNFCETYSQTVRFGLELRTWHDIIRWRTLRGMVALYMIPALFVLFGYKYIKKEPLCQLAIIMLVLGTFIWYFTKQGFDLLTDYAWSYIYSLYFMIVTAAIFSVKYMRNKKYQICFALLWLTHFAFGIRYILYILRAGYYS